MASAKTVALRSQQRAEDKASRAAAAGLVLPKRKKKNGWALLRQKLRDHTLLPALRAAAAGDSGMKRRGSATARRTSIFALKSHLADVAYQLGRKSGVSEADAKLLAQHQKAAHEISKRKREERHERRKLIHKQKKLERELEYLNFPTILGWYFDGFFTPYFQLNEEYATIFNQMELEISKLKENQIKETFAEKAKRYFWPPDYCGNFCFRTRGIYLDLKEVMKDPPHTPPEVILDQRTEAITLFVGNDPLETESKVPSEEEEEAPVFDPGEQPNLAELAAEEDKMQTLLKAIEDNPNLTQEEKAVKKRALLFAFKKKKEKSKLQQQVAKEMHFKAINKNDFYFDDQIPGFFKKRAKDRDKYYYDSKWDVWRIKRNIIYFPNDFYWDEQLAMFFPKDRTRKSDYYLYDPNLGCYRVAGEPVPPNWRGIKPMHFFFDHYVGKWLKKSKAPAGVSPSFDDNGQRFSANKYNEIPDDFFFDSVTQQFEKKAPGAKYAFDAEYGAWRLINGPLPGKWATKPHDFYWNEQEHKFVKKDAPSSFFVWDGNNKFFRKKKSLHGKFHPKNWTWVEKKKHWELKKSASRYNLISESLYWRPDRDYDKPWLEYVGGYRDYHIEYDYDRLSDDDQSVKIVGPGGRVMGTGRGTSTGKTNTGGTSSGKGGKKLMFSTSEPNLKTGGVGGDAKSGTATGQGTEQSVDDSSLSKSHVPGIIKEGSTHEEALTYVDTLDRKTLKVTNLGTLVTDMDLRKYFASVKKIVRPLRPDSDYEEDYAYLKFKTDEAAAAALKTMHHQKIRGQHIKLAYKLKEEDETVGGQRDNHPKQPKFGREKTE